MRKVLFMVLLALVAVPAASAAGGPRNQTGPSPSVATVVSGPTRILPGSVTGTITAGSAAGAAAPAVSGCGVCLTQCFGATVRSGPSDASGHVYIYQHLSWCGNGYTISSAGASQSYDQDGWYQLQAGYGPWFSGGCVGCSSISVAGYILWNWTLQLIGITHTGTTNLSSTMYPWGGVSAT
ncbi:MAG: hypothetical protein ABUS54_03310 [Actinomycetota bacterium]